MSVKVKEFSSFKELEQSRLLGTKDVVVIMTSPNNICADLNTSCSSYKTALKRFFKALKNDERFSGWQPYILENCENGCFNDREGYANLNEKEFPKGLQFYRKNGLIYFPNGWHYCIEEYAENEYYIELTIGREFSASEIVTFLNCLFEEITLEKIDDNKYSFGGFGCLDDEILCVFGDNIAKVLEGIEFFDGIIRKSYVKAEAKAMYEAIKQKLLQKEL